MSDTDKRQFGKFKCPTCQRKWDSPNTWPGFGQNCSKCNIIVMPFYLRPLINPYIVNRNPGATPHPKELCPKCKSLGYDCSTKP